MTLKNKKFLMIGIFIGIIVTLLSFLIFILINPYISSLFLLKDECNIMLRETCDVTNVCVDVVNKQSSLLENCYNYTFPILNRLDCDKLN